MQELVTWKKLLFVLYCDVDRGINSNFYFCLKKVLIKLFRCSYLPSINGIVILVVAAYGDRGRRGGKEDFTAEKCFSTRAGSDMDIECLLLSLPSLLTPRRFLHSIFSSAPVTLCCDGGGKIRLDDEVAPTDDETGTEEKKLIVGLDF